MGLTGGFRVSQQSADQGHFLLPRGHKAIQTGCAQLFESVPQFRARHIAHGNQVVARKRRPQVSPCLPVLCHGYSELRPPVDQGMQHCRMHAVQHLHHLTRLEGMEVVDRCVPDQCPKLPYGQDSLLRQTEKLLLSLTCALKQQQDPEDGLAERGVPGYRRTGGGNFLPVPAGDATAGQDLEFPERFQNGHHFPSWNMRWYS